MPEADHTKDLVSARGFVKRFGDHTAADNADVAVRGGERFGSRGSHGGETAAVRLLTTLSDLDPGTAAIGGHDIVKDPVGAKVCMGEIRQRVRPAKDLTVRENR